MEEEETKGNNILAGEGKEGEYQQQHL